MKNLIYCAIFSIFILQSCRKESKTIAIENKKLLGSWEIKSAKFYKGYTEHSEDAMYRYHYILSFHENNIVEQKYTDTNLVFEGHYYIGKTTLNMTFNDTNNVAHHSILLANFIISKKEFSGNDYEAEGNYDLTFKK